MRRAPPRTGLTAGDSLPAFVPTGTAAELLGVDRAFLDHIADRVASARPDLVFRVGRGGARRHFRWRRDALAEAVNAAPEVVPEVPAERTMERRSATRAAKPTLRSLIPKQ